MTEFGKYLTVYPEVLNDKTRLLGLLKDALRNDLPKYRILQAAYELGILDALRESNPLKDEDRMRMLIGLGSQYAMNDAAANRAVRYWQDSVNEVIFREAEAKKKTAEKRIVPITEPDSAEQTQHISKNRPTINLIRYDEISRGIRIQWKKIAGFIGYEIWRMEEENEPIMIKNGSFPMPRYIDKDIEKDKLYSYAIRGYQDTESGRVYTEGSNDMQIIAADVSQSFQVSEIKITECGIELQWPYIVGSDDFIIEKFDPLGDDWYRIANLPDNQLSFEDKHSLIGEINQYRVTCNTKSNGKLMTREIAIFV